MANLELRNLNKTYSSKVVPVKDISLKVDEGEFLTLLGPSGCGKSTTLRLIAGLEQPTRGQIWIGERNVTDLRSGDRNIAMVFQSYALYPHMTVAENIASSLKLRHLSKLEIRQRVTDVATKLGLEELTQRKPSQLSGGQRQRVALARALVRQPDVFLLDEPLSNLDALLRERVRAELKQLFKAQNTPVVYVTHDQTEAMTLSSKVAVLYNGNLQQLDPPQRIYTHPANRFVASFVGSPQMNLFVLSCRDNAAWLGNFPIPVPLPTVPPQIVLGIRPENVCLARAEDTHTIQGQIYLVESLGMQNLLSVRVQGAPELTIRALLPAAWQWSDDIVKLTLSPQSLHWFDAATGDRLF
ncbi:MAG: ABC transporter ATP-binding protein [Chroococcidiopsidaceae cyanobacterium CP_BM_ER_R8_30]|nr:ABC transporter ATP-binding protein [Chroococcidiopsidaceae cyanobacterium CP_BM_ER_R8_30]